MERHITLEEISDGKLYTLNDMVKAGCQDCENCFACCQGMGTSILLDPMDIYRLSSGTAQTFEALLTSGHIELNISDGIILPNLSMSGPAERCSYLTQAGRCSIHPYRPGICRLFPLGRIYEDETFHYFLQTHECKKTNRTKIKIKKWMDTPDPAVYEQYIKDWHYYLKSIQDHIRQESDEAETKAICMAVLKEFYMRPYDLSEDFYPQFYDRLSKSKKATL